MKTFEAISRHQGAIFNQMEGMGGEGSGSRGRDRLLYTLGDKLGQPDRSNGKTPTFQAHRTLDAQILGAAPLSFPIPYRATAMSEARPIA
jgi:hypothetical protein